MFRPQLQKTAQSQRIVPDSYINSGLPLKSKKNTLTNTQKWLKKEKKRLLADMKSVKKSKSARSINISAKKPKMFTDIEKFKMQAIEISKNGIKLIYRSSF